MDWRERKYYCVSFDRSSVDMRLNDLKLISNRIKLYNYRDVPKQPDEIEQRGLYRFLLSIPIDCCDIVEFVLKKAERRDTYCTWKEIQRDCKDSWDI